MPNYSTSANNNDSNAWKAFDNKADTNWTASYTTTGELVFNFGVPTTIKGVRFTPVSNKLTSFPKKAYLSGSSGSGSPTELQTFNLTEPTDDTPQSFKFDNTPVKYATYIFTFGDTFAASSGTKEVAIAEIEFLVSKGIVIPEPKLQEKTVTPSESEKIVKPDEGYDGLSQVTVEKAALQEKSVAPTTSQQVVTADSEYYGLSKVVVSAAAATNLQEKSATPSTSQQIITPDTSYDGLSKVTIGAATLQVKTVSPSTTQQIVTPDSSYYGLSKVTVEASAATTPFLQAKTVSPSTSSQSITADSGYDGLSKVTVNAAALQTKTVTPTKSSQSVTTDSSYYGMSKVTVNAIPSTYISTTDATATASDIKTGKTAYVNGSKVTGTYNAPASGSAIAGVITFNFSYATIHHSDADMVHSGMYTDVSTSGVLTTKYLSCYTSAGAIQTVKTPQFSPIVFFPTTSNANSGDSETTYIGRLITSVTVPSGLKLVVKCRRGGTFTYTSDLASCVVEPSNFSQTKNMLITPGYIMAYATDSANVGKNYTITVAFN